MFIQVVQGKVSDAAHLNRAFETWRADASKSAIGYLGSTGGITPDGTAITLARFESEEAARANSDRPEQGAWWADTSKAYDGEVTFHDCAEVDLLGHGGADNAGFVQVIQGRVTDQAAARARIAESGDSMFDARPDILGGLIAWHGDGGFTQAMYFTSEQEARKGEVSPEFEQLRDDFMATMDGPPTFYDLPDPDID